MKRWKMRKKLFVRLFAFLIIVSSLIPSLHISAETVVNQEYDTVEEQVKDQEDSLPEIDITTSIEGESIQENEEAASERSSTQSDAQNDEENNEPSSSLTESNSYIISEIFEDDNLAEVIARVLEKSSTSSTVTTEELGSIRSLGAMINEEGIATGISLANKNIKSLRGIEYLTNLRRLNISNNQISDLSPLENLTEMVVLAMSRNKISDISSLSNLTKLETLWLYNNEITDLSPLASATKLEDLRIDNNNINNLEALSDMKELKFLSAPNNEITDINGLANATELEELWLFNNNISNVNALSEMNELKFFYGYNNQITDISGLSNATELEILWIYNNKISNIDALSEMSELKSLSAHSNEINDISGLSNVTALEDLKLYNNNISNVEALSEMSELKLLSVYNNAISDISMLSKLTKLEELRIGNNDISNIDVLSEMSGLKLLSAHGNKISDINVLSSLIELEELWIYNNKISNIDALSEMKSLKIFYAYNNEISDISVLSNTPKLETLWLYHNKISDISPLSDLPLTDLRAHGQTITLPETVLRTPTDFTLANIDGFPPIMEWTAGTGTYENNQLIWDTVSESGENQLTWTVPTTGGTFSGTVTQSVLMADKNMLWFVSVPSVLKFETMKIKDSVTTINREEPGWSMSIGDTRRLGSTWIVTAAVDKPLTSVEDDHTLPENVIVFKNGEHITPLTSEPMEVFSGTKGNEVTTDLSWGEEDGVLLHLNPIVALADTTYETTITWTLVDSWQPSAELTLTPTKAEVSPGGTKPFTAYFVTEFEEIDVTNVATWSVSNNTSSDTTIVNGLLTVGSDEEASELEVTVSYDGKTKSTPVTVLIPGAEFEVDGREWKVVRNEGNYVLVLSKFVVGRSQYRSDGLPGVGTTLQEAMDDFYVNNLSEELKEYTVGVSYPESIESAFTSESDVTTVDTSQQATAFPLGLGDLNTSEGMNTATKRIAFSESGNRTNWWLRTRRGTWTGGVGTAWNLSSNGTSSNNSASMVTNEAGVRPALMVNVEFFHR